jgi:hypothetical protein
MNPTKTMAGTLAALLFALPVVVPAQTATPPASAVQEPAEADEAETPAQAAARKKAERDERQRLAVAERAAKEKELQEEIVRRCVIRPVMTDPEIDTCRVVYRK